MSTTTADALAAVATYYSETLGRHGATAQGVDWNGAESQARRFGELARIIDRAGGFSVNDLGCGYGALFDYLRAHFRDFVYRGYDIAPEMVAAATERHAGAPGARFSVGRLPAEPADYGIASGIFNVKLDTDDTLWRRHIEATLDGLDATSLRGFAFNCLTTYSDRDKMRDHLHYADPAALFDLCKRRYARDVALLHDYGLYEFTILVRKRS
jgi:SAM-dependent methyltransferase